jgi:hypothetical protein
VDGVLSGTYNAVRFRSTSFLFIDTIMTIEQIANRIIKDIKAWPEEARQSQDDGGPKSCWDEYKEQIQYEEHDSFEVFEETVASMADEEVSKLSDKVINNLYGTLFTSNYPVPIDEKRKNIINEVLSYIKSEAECQDIEYEKIDVEFVRYSIGDLTIVAEFLSKVGPEEFLIRGYSEVTGTNGEQGLVNISDLADEQGFEWISLEEFNREKIGLKTKRLLQAGIPHEIESQINKNKETSTDSSQTKFKHYWDDPKVQERMSASSTRLKAQSEERNRRYIELQSQMDQQGIPMGDLREVRFRILEKELFLGNLLDDAEDGVNHSKADMRLIPEIQHDLILLHDKEKSICDAEKAEKARIAKGVKDLVILVSKATKKSPGEVIKGMKLILDERSAKREQQALLIKPQALIPSIVIVKNEKKADNATQETTSTNINVGLDRDTRLAGITLSGILIESGTKKFEDYVKAMIASIGTEIKPYLKQFYSMERFQPGFEASGMSSHDDVDIADVEKIIEGI